MLSTGSRVLVSQRQKVLAPRKWEEERKRDEDKDVTFRKVTLRRIVSICVHAFLNRSRGCNTKKGTGKQQLAHSCGDESCRAQDKRVNGVRLSFPAVGRGLWLCSGD